MMEEFHVAYLVYYTWQDPEEGPDCLVSCRLVASGKDHALIQAKAKLPQVIANYTDEQDEVTEANVMIEIRPWAAWGNQLDKNWETICALEAEDDE